MQSTLFEFLPQAATGPDLTDSREAGRQCAGSITATLPRGKRASRVKKGQAERILARARSASDEFRPWLTDNARLLRTAEKQALEFVGGARRIVENKLPPGLKERVKLWL